MIPFLSLNPINCSTTNRTINCIIAKRRYHLFALLFLETSSYYAKTWGLAPFFGTHQSFPIDHGSTSFASEQHEGNRSIICTLVESQLVLFKINCFSEMLGSTVTADTIAESSVWSFLFLLVSGLSFTILYWALWDRLSDKMIQRLTVRRIHNRFVP